MMNFMKKISLILGIVLTLTACGSYQQTVQVKDKSYLLILGDPTGGILTIDSGKPIKLGVDTTSFDLYGKTATKIQIQIGTHTVKIIKNGEIKVHRKFYISNGNSFEVEM